MTPLGVLGVLGELEHGPWAGPSSWAWGGVLAFAEAILGVGIVLPGEATITALAAVTPSTRLPMLAAAVAAGAVAGDHLNFALGRVLGVRLSDSRVVQRIGRQHWDRAVALMQRHGALALVVSRVVPVVRTIVPAVAGVARLRYRSFLAASVAGSTLWALAWVGAGAALVEAVTRSPEVTATATVLVAAGWLTTRRHKRRRGQDRARPTCSRTAGATSAANRSVIAVSSEASTKPLVP